MSDKLIELPEQKIDYGVNSHFLVRIHECDFSRYSNALDKRIKDLDKSEFGEDTYVVGTGRLVVVYTMSHYTLNELKQPLIAIHHILHDVKMSLDEVKDRIVDALDKINVDGIEHLVDVMTMKHRYVSHDSTLREVGLYPAVLNNKIVYDRTRYDITYRMVIKDSLKELEHLQKELINGYNEFIDREDLSKEEQKERRIALYELQESVNIISALVDMMVKNIPN